MEDIRNDLKEKRIYYSMKKTFEMGERYAGQLSEQATDNELPKRTGERVDLTEELKKDVCLSSARRSRADLYKRQAHV